MGWFVVARVLFLAAVAYTAVLLHPLGADPVLNVILGILLGAVFVVFEWRLRTTSVTHMLGAMLGGALGLAAARMLGRLALLGQHE